MRTSTGRHFGRRALGVLLGAASMLSAPLASAVEPWSDPDPSGPPSRLTLGSSTGFRGGARVPRQRRLDPPARPERHAGPELLAHRAPPPSRRRASTTTTRSASPRRSTSSTACSGATTALGADPEPDERRERQHQQPERRAPCITLRPGDPRRSQQLPLRPLLRRANLDPPPLRRRRHAHRPPPHRAAGVQRGRVDRRQRRRRPPEPLRLRAHAATAPTASSSRPSRSRPSSRRRARRVRDEGPLPHPRLRPPRHRTTRSSFARRPPQLHHRGALLEPSTGSARTLEVRLYHAYRWSSDNGTRINAFGGRAMSHVRRRSRAGSRPRSSSAARARSARPSASSPTTRPSTQADHAARRARASSATIGRCGPPTSSSTTPPATPTRRRARRSRSSASPRTRTSASSCSSTCSPTRRRARPRPASRRCARLGAPSYPAEAIDTRGSFTNAFAIFPQFDVRPVQNLLLRGGVLMAWAPARSSTPSCSLQRATASASRTTS